MSELKDYVLEKTTIINKNVVKTLDESGSGSSDFSIANVTLNTSLTQVIGYLPVAVTMGGASAAMGAVKPSPGGATYSAILYKGMCMISCPGYSLSSTDSTVEIDEDGEEAIITGDCTIIVGSNGSDGGDGGHR